MSKANKIIRQNKKNIRGFGKIFKTLYLSKQNTKSGIDHFKERVESRNGIHTIDIAEELKIGTKEYELIII
mgnify:CR=1 FL=1